MISNYVVTTQTTFDELYRGLEMELPGSLAVLQIDKGPRWVSRLDIVALREPNSSVGHMYNPGTNKFTSTGDNQQTGDVRWLITGAAVTTLYTQLTFRKYPNYVSGFTISDLVPRISLPYDQTQVLSDQGGTRLFLPGRDILQIQKASSSDARRSFSLNGLLPPPIDPSREVSFQGKMGLLRDLARYAFADHMFTKKGFTGEFKVDTLGSVFIPAEDIDDRVSGSKYTFFLAGQKPVDGFTLETFTKNFLIPLTK